MQLLKLVRYSLLATTLINALPTQLSQPGNVTISMMSDLTNLNEQAITADSLDGQERQLVLDLYSDYLCNSLAPVHTVTYSGGNFGDPEMKGCFPMPCAEQGLFIRVMDSSGCRASTKNVMAQCDPSSGDAEVEISGCRVYSYSELHIDCSG